MINAPPSNAYIAAAQANGFGAPWQSDDPERRDFTFAFLSFSQAMYRTAIPKKRTNLAGQDFAYEFQFLAGTDLPNAYAFSDFDGRKFVGITASLFGFIGRVCDDLFADDDFFDILNADVQSLGQKELKITKSFLDILPKKSAVFSNFDTDDEYIALLPHEGWRNDYREIGDWIVAKRIKYRVRDAMLAYIFHHEIGHLIEGHVDLLLNKFGTSALGESDYLKDTAVQRIAMEFEADNAASKALALATHTRQSVSSKLGILCDLNQEVVIDCFAIFAVQSILAMASLATQEIFKGEKLSEWEVKDVFLASKSYPSAGVRSTSSLNMYLMGMEACSKSASCEYVESEVILKFSHILKLVGDKYGDFAMMVSILKVHEDQFHLDREVIAKDATIKQVSDECAPYSFGRLGPHRASK